MNTPSLTDLPHWISGMPGGAAREELPVAAYLPLRFEAYCRVLNPARSGGGIARRWADIGAPERRVSAQTQWREVSDQLGVTDLPRLDPAMGGLDPETAGILASILGSRTSTPDSVYYLAWEGYSSLSEDYRSAPTVVASCGRVMHVLHGSIDDYSAAALAGLGGAPLWWLPADGAWAVGNDIYARSVYVGGSAACIEDILEHPGLESYPVAPVQKVASEDT